jgi:agmatine deiminase
MNNFDQIYSMPISRQMPAEWEKHAGCIMVWPADDTPWPGDLPAVQRDYAAVARAINSFEPLTMVVAAGAAAQARVLLGDDIKLLTLPYNDAWVRDSGPTFVRENGKQLAAVTWRFNGWGGAAGEFGLDAKINLALARHVGVKAVNSALAMEGGAIHVDGEGTLLTTETVVFNGNRNPGITREAAEAEFARTLGIEKTIWLPGNPHEFGTNGHIDGIACFVRPGVVMFETSASSRPHYREVTARNFAALQNQTDARGRKLELAFIEEAPDEGRGRPGEWGYSTSYVNFYIANGGIVMPAFGLAQYDAAAKAAMAAAFPDRRIAQVDISHLAAGGGGIHCITQQIPA